MFKKTVLEAMFETPDGERMGVSFSWGADPRIIMTIVIDEQCRTIPVGFAYTRQFAEALLDELPAENTQ